LIGILLVATHAHPAAAQDSIREMYHKSWTGHDGAPNNIDTIAVGTDGLLWITTDNGLYYFDGVSFERFTPERKHSMNEMV
jgi:ligand-binding sensor domain-containing protein